jgi:hypothetical protein
MRIAEAARQASGVDVPLNEIVISTRGNVVRESAVAWQAGGSMIRPMIRPSAHQRGGL